MTHSICKNCYYWLNFQLPAVKQITIVFGQQVEKDIYQGECHHDAPILVIQDNQCVAEWPPTHSKQWCGKYSPISEHFPREKE